MSRGVALILSFCAACGSDGARPAVVILPGMVDSVPFDSFDEHPLFGSTQRAAPKGAIPYGSTPLSFGPGEKEALRAASVLENPLLPTRANLDRGKRLFETFCQVCHGPGGEGDGPIIGRFPNPPSYLGRHARSYADGRLFHVMSFGQGIMPSYAAQVPPEDRWRLVFQIRRLQGLLKVASDEPPQTLSATVSPGGAK